MDECADGTATCHALAMCENMPGTYTCTCNDGYEGNGVDSCTGIIIHMYIPTQRHVAFVLKVIIMIHGTHNNVNCPIKLIYNIDTCSLHSLFLSRCGRV